MTKLSDNDVSVNISGLNKGEALEMLIRDSGF